jgi:tetratricopeptide (TPR) repeat protein
VAGMTEQKEPDLPAEIKPAETISLAAKLRPQTNNWMSAPFLLACFSWSLVSVICFLNVLFAAILVSEGEIAPALFTCVYGLLVLWVFGSTLIGAPMLFLAIKELERRNFFVAEKYLSRYLDLVKGLRLYQDGYYTVAVANLALIKLARGDYHHAEVLYEELINQVKKRKRLARHSLTAVYINNLACVKVAQACTHADLFDLELQEAERLAQEALALWQGAKGKKTEQAGAAYPLQLLSEIDILRGDLSAAETKLAEVIKLNCDGKQSYFILPEARQGLYFESHLWLTLLYLKQGKKEAADPLCRRLIGELRARPAPVFQHSMSVLNRLAVQYMEMGAVAEAENVLEFAYSVARGYPHHPEAHDIALSFERLLTETKRTDEIADMKMWIRPVLELGHDQA